MLEWRSLAGLTKVAKRTGFEPVHENQKRAYLLRTRQQQMQQPSQRNCPQMKRLLHYGRDSPLRPEMAESTLALFRATGATRYLRAGADLLRALQKKSKVPCGYASVGDVSTGVLDDRMDSYFIAETLKYLFLLFDRLARDVYRPVVYTMCILLIMPL